MTDTANPMDSVVIGQGARNRALRHVADNWSFPEDLPIEEKMWLLQHGFVAHEGDGVMISVVLTEKGSKEVGMSMGPKPADMIIEIDRHYEDAVASGSLDEEDDHEDGEPPIQEVTPPAETSKKKRGRPRKEKSDEPKSVELPASELRSVAEEVRAQKAPTLWKRLFDGGWRIVGMNHYDITTDAGKRTHLFVAMMHPERGLAIKAEGLAGDEVAIFLKLEEEGAGLFPVDGDIVGGLVPVFNKEEIERDAESAFKNNLPLWLRQPTSNTWRSNPYPKGTDSFRAWESAYFRISTNYELERKWL